MHTKRLLPALALLALLLVAPVQAQPTSDPLERVADQLLRLEKPGALFAYLRTQHPEFFALADRAGLDKVLDGECSPEALLKAAAPELEAPASRAGNRWGPREW